MIFQVNDETVLELSETQKNIICNDINLDDFDSDMKQRVSWVIQNKLEACSRRLRDEWTPKLQLRGVESIPTDNEAFAEVVFAQADYKSRKERDAQGTL